uniref:Nuclear speckle splicing regulatory protein 1 n=1 Tax=Schistosoma haematobium TaxID=6185 RepID=A0A094ZHS3_SCHHA
MNQGRGKVYGLSFPTRKPKNEIKVSVNDVFNEESDKEENYKELVKTELEKAFEEDPSVFQYDEYLDDIHDKKAEDISRKTVKTSKYVGRLIKASNERKLERELCVERKAQKEIEAESDMCNNKESFVTSAYKSKLSELRALVEKRKEEEEREKVMDVCKQDGLGGFYRFMFDNQDKTSAGYTEECHHRTTSKEDCLEADSNSASTIKKQTVKEHTRKKTDVITEQYDNDDNNNNNKNVSSPSPNKAFPNCDDDDGVTESDRKDDKTRASHQSKKDLNTYLNKKNQKIPGIIMARLRVTTDEELIAARQRYLDRKAAGIHAVIVESD